MMPWDLNVTGYKGRTRDGKTGQAIGLVPKGWVICHPVPGIQKGVASSSFTRPHSHLRRLVWGPALKQESDGGAIVTQKVLKLWVRYFGEPELSLSWEREDRV